MERLAYDAARCQVEVRSDTRGECRTLSALDFVAELSVHVPDRRGHTVHYPGPLSRKAFRRSWAELLKKVWNIDALLCPKWAKHRKCTRWQS